MPQTNLVYDSAKPILSIEIHNGKWKITMDNKWLKWLSIFHSKVINGFEGYNKIFGIKCGKFSIVKGLSYNEFKYKDYDVVDCVRMDNENLMVGKFYYKKKFRIYFIMERKL